MANPFSLQALPPAKAHFCLGVERFLQHELGLNLHGKRIVLGYSGGPDSTALLLCLHALAPRLSLTLAAAHINHGIRAESTQEEKNCTTLCRSLGIPLLVHRANVPALAVSMKAGLEETARKVRYDFFASLQSSWPYDFLAVGHHLDDLAEDVFLRLLRGTGWPALGGMVAHDVRRALIRPFLLTPRANIEDFLHSLPVPLAHDASNATDCTLRNRIRHHIIPFFLMENPQFLQSIAGLSRLAQFDTAFFTRQIESTVATAPHAEPLPDSSPVRDDASAPENRPELYPVPCSLDKAKLKALPQSLRLRLYKQCLDSLGPGQALLSNLLDLDSCWLRNKGGSTIQFPGGKTARIHKGNILFAFLAREV